MHLFPDNRRLGLRPPRGAAVGESALEHGVKHVASGVAEILNVGGRAKFSGNRRGASRDSRSSSLGGRPAAKIDNIAAPLRDMAGALYEFVGPPTGHIYVSRSRLSSAEER
jgi:hypothetical protein